MDLASSSEDERRARLLERLCLPSGDNHLAFDRLTRVAAAATDSPVSMLTFLGLHRLWIASHVGWEANAMPRSDAFCRCTVDSPELLEVPDANEDPRFLASPLVTGPQAVRYYAGHPVIFEGLVLGTVCVLDRKRRSLSAEQKAVLADLAGMASDLLTQRSDQLLRQEREAQTTVLRAAHQRSEAMLAAAERVTQLGSWEMHPATGNTLFSAETLRLLRWPGGPLAFKDLVARLRHDGGRPFEPVIEQPLSCELRLEVPNADDRWIRWVSRPIERAPGEHVVVGTLQDISESIAAQRRLQTVEKRFHLLWKTTTDVVVMLDANNLIRFVNPAVKELLGQDPDALLGQDLAVLQPERFRAAHRHGFMRYLRSGVRRLDWRAVEAVALRADGHEIPIEISFSDMDVDGERMFAACIRDLSARKRQEAALQQSEERYRLIVETAAEGIWLLDEAGATRFVNPFMATMLGHSAEAMVGSSFTDHLATGDTGRHEDERRRLRQADAPGREVLLRHAGGAEVWARVVSNPILDANGRYLGALAMVTDVTDSKRADAARRRLSQQLREAQKMEAIGTLAGGVAHDFNNVLAGILGNVALLRDEIDREHPARKYLRQIENGGHRGRELVGQILSFARQQPQVLQACELNALVEESAGLLRATLPASARLSLELAPPPVGIHADATQIAQVVMNLCKNAGQALGGADGEIVIGTGMTWLGEEAAARAQVEPGRFAHLWVRDSGKGMSEETLARIFEPFFTTKAANDGTGLGLAVVHGIVGAHAGAIVVDSTPGHGSCFNLYLRPSDVPAGLESRPAPLGDNGLVHGSGERVLYVDDDDVMLAMVEQLLQRLGYNCVAVSSVPDALAAVQAAAEGFDAVVSDFNMPGHSGLHLAETLVALRPDLPVLLSSGSVTEELLAESSRLGVRRVLRKEFLVEELGHALAEVLARQ